MGRAGTGGACMRPACRLPDVHAGPQPRPPSSPARAWPQPRRPCRTPRPGRAAPRGASPRCCCSSARASPGQSRPLAPLGPVVSHAYPTRATERAGRCWGALTMAEPLPDGSGALGRVWKETLARPQGWERSRIEGLRRHWAHRNTPQAGAGVKPGSPLSGGDFRGAGSADVSGAGAHGLLGRRAGAQGAARPAAQPRTPRRLAGGGWLQAVALLPLCGTAAPACCFTRHYSQHLPCRSPLAECGALLLLLAGAAAASRTGVHLSPEAQRAAVDFEGRICASAILRTTGTNVWMPKSGVWPALRLPPLWNGRLPAYGQAAMVVPPGAALAQAPHVLPRCSWPGARPARHCLRGGAQRACQAWWAQRRCAAWRQGAHLCKLELACLKGWQRFVPSPQD